MVVDEKKEDFLEPINKWFDGMMKRELIDTTPSEDVSANAQRYEELGVIESEISRIQTNMTDKTAVNQQVRASLENYIEDEDETLPDIQHYTADFSRVNYDVSIAWLDNRREQCMEDRIKQGARTMCMAIGWLNKFAFKPQEGSMSSMLNIATELFQEHVALNKEATVSPENALTALYEMVSTLGLNEEQVDVSFVHDTTNLMMKKRVLQVIGSAYLSPMLDQLQIDLVESDSKCVEFKDYTIGISDLLRELSRSQLVGTAEGEAVTSITTGFASIDKLNEQTNTYTKDMGNKGSANLMDLDYIDMVINTNSRLPLLIDPETDVQDKLTQVYEKITKAYNLDEVQGETCIEVRQPSTLLSVMDNEIAILLAVIDATRVRADMYNSLVTLLEGKIVLYKAYSVYLSSLAE